MKALEWVGFHGAKKILRRPREGIISKERKVKRESRRALGRRDLLNASLVIR